MSKRPVFFRRRYIIKRGLQFRYIGIIFIVALLAAVVTGYTVFATTWTLLGEKLANVYPQGRLVYVFRATNMVLVRNLLFISPFVFIIALLFSHKIAGPVYRIERSLDEIAKGNLAMRIKLRKGDELWDLANNINAMVESLDKNVILNKETVLKIQKDLDEIKKAIPHQASQASNAAQIRSSMNSLEAKIKELEASLKTWITT
ncbi:HAMP domain-containing protein [Candidatus Omnitrophota bacterium]